MDPHHSEFSTGDPAATMDNRASYCYYCDEVHDDMKLDCHVRNQYQYLDSEVWDRAMQEVDSEDMAESAHHPATNPANGHEELVQQPSTPIRDLEKPNQALYIDAAYSSNEPQQPDAPYITQPAEQSEEANMTSTDHGAGSTPVDGTGHEKDDYEQFSPSQQTNYPSAPSHATSQPPDRPQTQVIVDSDITSVPRSKGKGRMIDHTITSQDHRQKTTQRDNSAPLDGTNGDNDPEAANENATQNITSADASKTESALDFHPEVSTDPEWFTSPQDAKDWLKDNVDLPKKPDIPNDDFDNFGDAEIMEKGKLLYQALFHNPEGAQLKWEQKVKTYYHQNQRNSTTAINKMVGTPHGHRKVLANCIMAAKELQKIHSEGTAEWHYEKEARKNKKDEVLSLELTCSQRYSAVIDIIQRNKSIAKGLAQGKFLHVIHNPAGRLHRELFNIEGNAKKAKKSDLAHPDAEVQNDGDSRPASSAAATADPPAAGDANTQATKKQRQRPKKAGNSASAPSSDRVQAAPATQPPPGSVAEQPIDTTGDESVETHQQQSSKRKRGSEDDSGTEHAMQSRQVQHSGLNQTVWERRRQQLENLRAAAPSLIDPKIMQPPVSGHGTAPQPPNRPIHSSQQYQAPTKKSKRKTSDAGLDHDGEANTSHQRAQEQAARNQHQMSAHRDHLAEAAAAEQLRMYDIQATQQHHARNSGFHYPQNFPQMMQPNAFPPQGQNPAQGPMARPFHPSTAYHSTMQPNAGYGTPSLNNTHYSMQHNGHGHAFSADYLRTTQPFDGYARMRQSQQMHREPQSTMHPTNQGFPGGDVAPQQPYYNNEHTEEEL